MTRKRGDEVMTLFISNEELAQPTDLRALAIRQRAAAVAGVFGELGRAMKERTGYPKNWSVATVRRMVEAHAAGETYAALARGYGVADITVKRAIAEYRKRVKK